MTFVNSFGYPVQHRQTKLDSTVVNDQILTDISELVPRVCRLLGQRVVAGRDFVVSPGNHPLTKKPEDSGYEIETSATIFYFTIPPTNLASLGGT